MLWTDAEVAEAKSKPASELPCLDEGPYLNASDIFDMTVFPFVLPNYAKLIRLTQATPCRQRD